MADPSFLSLLSSIIDDPDNLGSSLIDTIKQYLSPSKQLLVSSITDSNTFVRAALAGLLLDEIANKPNCNPSFRPYDIFRTPKSGFTIRDIVKLPLSGRVPKAHSRKDIERANVLNKIPLVVEVQSIGIETRPDLIAVVETALNDEPSETVQILRAFVAGYKGYDDCPQLKPGNPVFTSIINLLLQQGINTTQLLSTDWFNNQPWTAVMAAPLRQPTYGQISDAAIDKCLPEGPEEGIYTKPVPVAPIDSPGISIDQPYDAYDAEKNGFGNGSGSGNGSEATTPIYNLWALAIPDEIYQAVTRMFFARSLLRTRVSKVVYTSTEFDRSESKEFLGQANFDDVVTWGEYIEGCQGYDPSSTQSILFSTKVGTISLGDEATLRKFLNDEQLIQLSEQLPLNAVPWNRNTRLIPSDIYLLKPIPYLGVAVSIQVRIWQPFPETFPFTRTSAEIALYPSLRAVLSPADVPTFTPDPLLCVARSSRQEPGVYSTSVTSTTQLNTQQVNTYTSSATPNLSLYRDQYSKYQAVNIGPNLVNPGTLTIRVALEAWIETLAPSIFEVPSGPRRPDAPLLPPLTYYYTLVPLGDLVGLTTPSIYPPLNLMQPTIFLDRRRPLSENAFLEWVKRKLYSFRTFRTAADRVVLRPKVPRSTQVYNGTVPPLLSAVASFAGSQLPLRSIPNVAQYGLAPNQSFILPRQQGQEQTQSYLQGVYVAKPV